MHRFSSIILATGGGPPVRDPSRGGGDSRVCPARGRSPSPTSVGAAPMPYLPAVRRLPALFALSLASTLAFTVSPDAAAPVPASQDAPTIAAVPVNLRATIRLSN